MQYLQLALCRLSVCLLNMKRVISGQLVLPAEADRVRIAPGWLAVEGGVISELVEGEVRSDADFGGPEHLISPGFIDAHLHLPQFPCLGAYGMQLLDWLQSVVFPAEARWADAAVATADCRRVIGDLLAHGTTGIMAFATNHRDATEAALQVCQEMGIWAKVGQALSDQGLPPALSQPTKKNIDDCRQTLDRWPPAGSGRVCAAVAPRFALTCSEALMYACGELAAGHGAWVETHLAEMEAECERACALHDSPDYTSIYARCGLLGPRSFMGHGIYLSAAERKTLAESGTVVAHCPTSNTFLRSGTMPRLQWLNDGLRVAVGSDVAGGYERSMVRVARSMLEVSFFAGEAPASAAQAWHAITSGNAALLGWDRTGQLAVGMDADIVLAQPDPAWLNAPDPLGYLLWSWDDRWLKQVFLRGHRLPGQSRK